jgi:outer membrane protein assembly factor BamB
LSPIAFGGEVLFKSAVHYDEPTQVIQKPRDMAVDEDGNVYLLDTGMHRVFVWEKSGRFIQTFGQQGEGPGEFAFEDGVGNLTVTSDYIVITDDRIKKVHFWSHDLRYLRSISKPGLGRIKALHAIRDKFVVVNNNIDKGNHELQLLDENFDMIDTLAALNQSLYVRNDRGGWDYHPFASLLIVGIYGDEIWYSDTNDNWVRCLNVKGELVREFRVPLMAEELPQAEKQPYAESFESWRSSRDRLFLPDFNSVIDFIYPLDDDILIVSQYRFENGRCQGLALHRKSGKILGRFTQLLGDDVGFLSSIDGKLVCVDVDEDGDYRLSQLKLILETDNEAAK